MNDTRRIRKKEKQMNGEKKINNWQCKQRNKRNIENKYCVRINLLDKK